MKRFPDLDVYSFRYLSLIVVICSIIGSLLMFYMGAMKTFTAALLAVLDFFSINYTLFPHHLSPDTASMLLVVEAVDNFLFGLVLLLFSFGIYTLFIRPFRITSDEAGPSWLKIKSISELKTQLAQVIIIMLFVLFLERVMLLGDEDPFEWTMLVLPAAILALALSLWCMHGKE